VEPPPVTPFTCHVTIWLVVPVTVALNCSLVPVGTVAAVGPTKIETWAALIVTETEADAEVLACDVALIVTVAGFGTVAGAV
jgi:hypothetical protein